MFPSACHNTLYIWLHLFTLDIALHRLDLELVVDNPFDDSNVHYNRGGGGRGLFDGPPVMRAHE